MNVAILSSSDGRRGGHAAAYRLHLGLIRLGVRSKLVVSEKTREDETIVGPKTKFQKGVAMIRPHLDSLPLKWYPSRQQLMFSPAVLPDSIVPTVGALRPEVIHMHWVNGGFLRIETLKHFRAPLIWTLHDMWPFTGGCHYDNECGRFRTQCGSCPMLGSRKQKDLAHWVFSRKRKAWKKLNLTFVSPSRWLAKCAQQSSLFREFRVEVIPNGLDLSQYQPIDKEVARTLIGVPRDKQLILFGAVNSTSDKRKGFDYLQPALQLLKEKGWKDKAALVVFGASEPDDASDLGLSAHYLGKLHDDVSLTVLYSAADVFVAPSRQDNLPNTIMEALACGTPCVAFDIGGIPDMIEHKQNGYLAEAYEPDDLARGVSWVLDDIARWRKLSRRARQKVEQEFELSSVARRYNALYEEVIAGSGS
ncbi:MAG: glycosyltransferase family 4 protein [Acidiferrobacterales bacterium]